MTQYQARDVQCWHYDDRNVNSAEVNRFLCWWYVIVRYHDGCVRYYARYDFADKHYPCQLRQWIKRRLT